MLIGINHCILSRITWSLDSGVFSQHQQKLLNQDVKVCILKWYYGWDMDEGIKIKFNVMVDIMKGWKNILFDTFNWIGWDLDTNVEIIEL